MTARTITALLLIAAAVLLLAAALTGCSREAEQSARAGRDFQVDTLFTHESCTVYRFHDGGYAHYFTNCTGSTVYEQYYGKGQRRPDGISGGKP